MASLTDVFCRHFDCGLRRFEEQWCIPFKAYPPQKRLYSYLCVSLCEWLCVRAQEGQRQLMTRYQRTPRGGNVGPVVDPTHQPLVLWLWVSAVTTSVVYDNACILPSCEMPVLHR